MFSGSKRKRRDLMPNTWSRGGKILLAIFMMVAMTCAVVVFSGSGASAAVAHTPTVSAANGEYATAVGGCFSGPEQGRGDIKVTFYNFPAPGGGNTVWYYNGPENGQVNEAFYQSTAGQPTPLVVSEWISGAYSLSVTWNGGSMPATSVSVPDCTNGNGSPPPPAISSVVGMAATPSGNGYLLVSSNGAVSAHGDAVSYGDMSATALNKPIVGMAPTADGKGYWLDASDGGIFSFGDAQFYGSMGGSHLNQPMVGMASTPGGHGYWTVAADGGIFSFGDAAFHGSMGSSHLNQPVDGMAVDMVTGGYWLVASDGGIFAFNAPFYGSTGNLHLNQPIIQMEASPSGNGYRFAASDGGVFSFNLPFEGSLGSNPPPDPIAGMAAHSSDGYWLVEQNGTVHNFGSAPAV
jgi:hypothetical protein